MHARGEGGAKPAVFGECEGQKREERGREGDGGGLRLSRPTSPRSHLDLFFSLSPFQAIPLVNVTLPLVYKSFAAVYSADMVLLAAIFAWKLGGDGGSKEGGEGEQAS